ncbi:MAG: hypothetical protein ACXIUQ_09875 [Cecembia sp.]
MVIDPNSKETLEIDLENVIKDGLYDYNYYQLNPMKDLTIGRRVIVDNFTEGFGQSPSIVEGYFNELGQPILIEGDPRIYFSFISSHFLQLDFDGNVLWDYAIPLPKNLLLFLFLMDRLYLVIRIISYIYLTTNFFTRSSQMVQLSR